MSGPVVRRADARRTLVAQYLYPDEHGRALLRKLRYEPKDFCMHGRRREGWQWLPPRYLMNRYPRARPYFAGLLYRLPQLRAAIESWPLSSTNAAPGIYWTEGEKDADAIVAAGGIATSHWQGAGNATAQQAAWFRRYPGWIFLVADWDLPGALDSARRYDLLRSVGVRAAQIGVVRAAVGKDAADHIAAGYLLHHFRTVDRKRWRAAAAKCGPSAFHGAGYLTPEERAEIGGWRPRVVPRSARR